MATENNIFIRDKAGETISLDDPRVSCAFKIILKAIRTTAALNTLVDR